MDDATCARRDESNSSLEYLTVERVRQWERRRDDHEVAAGGGEPSWWYFSQDIVHAGGELIKKHVSDRMVCGVAEVDPFIFTLAIGNERTSDLSLLDKIWVMVIGVFSSWLQTLEMGLNLNRQYYEQCSTYFVCGDMVRSGVKRGARRHGRTVRVPAESHSTRPPTHLSVCPKLF